MLAALRRKARSATINWNKASRFPWPRNGGQYQALFDTKYLLTAALRGAGIPTVTDIALLRGEHVTVFGNIPETEQRLQPFLERLRGNFFIKPATGEHGRSAGRMDIGDDDLHFNGQLFGLDELAEQAAASDCGLLLQEWQQQHEKLAQLCPNTLNTLRVLTLQRAPGEVEAMHAVLRIGRHSAWLDNFHAGGMALSVSLVKGTTIAPAVHLDRSDTYTHHPDTGVALDGYQLPQFETALGTVKSAHRLFPELKTVGWDIAIAPDGPRIVEGNLRWDVEIHAFADSRFRSRLVKELGRSKR